MTTRYDGFFNLYAGIYFHGLVAWPWFKAQAMAESSLRPDAVSPAGAQGLMQLMPATSREMAGILYIPHEPFDPKANIMMGICYAHRLWEVWQAEEGIERLRFTLASYNAGLGNILKAQRLAQISDRWASLAEVLDQVTGRHAQETITYVERVERYRLQLIEV